MFIIFDTETTDKAKNFKAPMTDLDNWPRIIQMSYFVYDINFNFVYSNTKLIKPDGWVIKDLKYWQNLGHTEEEVMADPEKNFWAKHGYTQEQNEREGVPMQEVLDDFIIKHDNCNFLAAHNLNFDINVLGAEMIRYNKKPTKKIGRICTMQESTEWAKIPHSNPRGRGYKWPTLSELYHKIFKKFFDGAHDAGEDVSACAACLEYLLKINVIGLPIIIDNVPQRIRYQDMQKQVALSKEKQDE